MTESADAPPSEIELVLALAEQIESSLASRRHGSGGPAADELVERATQMLGAVRDTPETPGRHPEADAELIAALHVLRNAAFAFRRIVDATGQREAALASACLAMIQQGRDHLDRFRRIADQ